MKKLILFAALPLGMLMACNDNQPEKDNSLVVPEEATVTPPAFDAAPQTETADTASNLSTVQPAPTPTATPQPQVQPNPAPAKNAVTAALNPAHGQPGHRCDIPVGAPLNSAPTNPSTPGNIINPVSTAPTPNVPIAQPSLPSGVNAGGSGKLNPAHGQPGHNCAVPVGAPLP